MMAFHSEENTMAEEQDALRSKASLLASQPFSVDIEKDTLLDGQEVIIVRNPELPGCLAQGASLAEALKELKEARTSYILSLLLDNMPIPSPENNTITAGGAEDFTFTIQEQEKTAISWSGFDKVADPLT